MRPSVKITDMDLYGLFDVLPSATESEIKKAYRKKALKCHPDKNPDNPKAKELFQQLSDALEILTDAKAKEAYDRTLKAKEQARLRHKELDAKRRKLKEDLEERERAVKEKAQKSSQHDISISNETRLRNEIERLRKEGSNALREEQEAMRKLIMQEKGERLGFLVKTEQPVVEKTPQVKVKWGSGESYDKEKLISVFSKFGKLLNVIVLKKSSLIEFSSQKDADMAYNHVRQNVPTLEIEWISKTSDSNTNESKSNPKIVVPPSNSTSNASTSNFLDFEAAILSKLSQAAAAQKQT